MKLRKLLFPIQILTKQKMEKSIKLREDLFFKIVLKKLRTKNKIMKVKIRRERRVFIGMKI